MKKLALSSFFLEKHGVNASICNFLQTEVCILRNKALKLLLKLRYTRVVENTLRRSIVLC